MSESMPVITRKTHAGRARTHRSGWIGMSLLFLTACLSPFIAGEAPLVLVPLGAGLRSVQFPFVATLRTADWVWLGAGGVGIVAWIARPIRTVAVESGGTSWWLRGLFVLCGVVGLVSLSLALTDASRSVVDGSGQRVKRAARLVVDRMVPFDWNEQSPPNRFRPPGRVDTRLLALGGSTALRRFSIRTQAEAEELRLLSGRREPLTGDDAIAPEVGGEQDAQRTADFAVLTRDGRRMRISLNDCRTLKEAVERINEAGEHTFSAAAESGLGIVIHDRTLGRPAHWLGTGENGADVLAQLIHAARLVLLTGVCATAVALLIGIPFGAWIGSAGGVSDLIGMRVIEIVMAVPRFFLILLVAAMIPAGMGLAGFVILIAAMGLVSWTRPARLVRTEMLRLRGCDFVLAARASGASRWRVIARHMLPHALGPVAVDSAFVFAGVIMLEISLSFLGVGVPAPQASWGRLLSHAVDPATGGLRWWLVIGPGLAVMAVVLSCHGIADGWKR